MQRTDDGADACEARNPAFLLPAFGDVLGEAGDLLQAAVLVEHRETARTDPPDRSVRARDAVLEIELALGIDRLAVPQHRVRITRHDRVEPGAR